MLSHTFNFTLLKSGVNDILNNDWGIIFQDTRYGVDRARAMELWQQKLLVLFDFPTWFSYNPKLIILECMVDIWYLIFGGTL